MHKLRLSLLETCKDHTKMKNSLKAELHRLA